MPILKALVDPPYQTSEAAKRGKELHHLLSLAVMKRPWHTDELSEEYVTFVENGLKLVRPILKNMNFISEKLVEFCYGNLYCPRIRADLAGISKGRTRLMVADWKSGDRITKVEGNTQLQLYAFGFWKRLPKRHTIRKVYCYIVQPSVPCIEKTVYTIAELLREVEKLRIIADKIQTGDTQFVPSDRRCRWCVVQQWCPAVSDKTNEGREWIRNFISKGDVDVCPISTVTYGLQTEVSDKITQKEVVEWLKKENVSLKRIKYKGVMRQCAELHLHKGG